MSSRLRILALGALATPAAFFCAQGAVQQVEYYRRGTLVWLAALLASAALHGLWVGLVRGGAGTLTAAGCWAACAALAGAGLRAWHIQTSGWMLEGLVAAVALVLVTAPGSGVAGRLARWREARMAIAVELEMAEGLVPWLRRCLGQAWRGTARSPIEAAHLTVQSALCQAVRAAGCRAAETIRQEEVRQLALTALESVGRQASVAYARAALECERHALGAAAQLRSAIAQTALDAASRERLAQTCEALLLSLTLPESYVPVAVPPERGRYEERPE